MKSLSEFSILAITGVALAGKNALYDCLVKLLPGVPFEPFQLADELKIDVCEFTKSKFGISSFTKNIEEKTLIRPILVETAEIRRKISKGTYYTSIIQPKIDESIKNGNLPCINDLRFCEYPEDENWWAKKNKGIIIHVSRYNRDGTFILPANHKEKANDPGMLALADYKLVWPTSNDYDYLCDIVSIQLKGLLTKIKQKYGII